MNKSNRRIVTNSELSSLACPRRWGYSYQDGLSPWQTAAPLLQGTLWDHCMGEWFRSGFQARPEDLDEIIIAPWLEQRTEFHEQKSGEYARERVQEDRDRADLNLGMLRLYIDSMAEYWSEFEVLGTQVQVCREITNARGSHFYSWEDVKGLKSQVWWYYAGAADAVVYHPRTESVWVVDHKTTDSVDLDQYLRKLGEDTQMPGYIWALQQPALGATIQTPLKPAGFIYDVVRRKLPRKPKMLKSGRLEKRADMDTTREVYLAEVINQGLNPDDYADFLPKLAGREFSRAEERRMTDREVSWWAEDLLPRVDLLRHFSKRKRTEDLPRQPSQCRAWNRPCDYYPICVERGGEVVRRTYQIRSVRHPELEGTLAQPEVGPERRKKQPEQPKAIEDDLDF